MQTKPQNKQLARDILEYWLKHPEAKETVTGIHCVWLKNWSNHEAVKQALDYLMQREWVAVRVPPPPEEIYKLNQGHLKEMMKFLSEQDEDC